MPAQDRTPAQRDHHLVVVRRVRNGLVTAGVLGSLGVAGLVAGTSHPATSTAPPAPTADSASPGGQPVRDHEDDSVSPWRGEGDDGRSDDRSEGQSQGQSQGQSRGQSQGQQQLAPPSLQPGTGSAHGSSGGS
jgi:hypothetical protein